MQEGEHDNQVRVRSGSAGNTEEIRGRSIGSGTAVGAVPPHGNGMPTTIEDGQNGAIPGTGKDNEVHPVRRNHSSARPCIFAKHEKGGKCEVVGSIVRVTAEETRQA